MKGLEKEINDIRSHLPRKISEAIVGKNQRLWSSGKEDIFTSGLLGKEGQFLK